MLPAIVVAAAVLVQPAADPSPDFRSQRPFREQLAKLEAGVPRPNALTAIERAAAVLEEVRKELPPLERDDDAPTVWGALVEHDVDPKLFEHSELALRLACEKGIEGIIAEAAAARGIVRRGGDGLLNLDLIPDVGTVRVCVLINTALMRRDIKAGKPDAWLRRFEQNLRLARLYEHDVIIIGYLVGLACQVRTLEEVAGIAQTLDDAALAKVASILNELPHRRPLRAIEGSTLYITASIEYVYERNALERLRYLTRSFENPDAPPPSDSHAPSASDPPLPFLVERKSALEKVEEFQTAAIRTAELSRQERKVDAFQPGEFEKSVGRQHAVFACMLPPLSKLMASVDQAETTVAGTQLLIAIERYRLKHGRYPSRVNDLSPEFITTIPNDPMTGRSFIYKPPERGPNEGNRTYLLYSPAFDDEDNGGMRGPSSPWSGADYVVNPPAPPPAAGQP